MRMHFLYGDKYDIVKPVPSRPVAIPTKESVISDHYYLYIYLYLYYTFYIVIIIIIIILFMLLYFYLLLLLYTLIYIFICMTCFVFHDISIF